MTSDRPAVCQELRCGRPPTEPFNAGSDDDPLVYWLCAEHRDQARWDRWSAQTGGVFLLGADAILETPKHVKGLSASVSGWQLEGDGPAAAFVELRLRLGFPQGEQYDDDLVVLVPTELARTLGTVLPSLADDAERSLG